MIISKRVSFEFLDLAISTFKNKGSSANIITFLIITQSFNLGAGFFL